MTLLPYQRVEILSSLSPEDLAQRIGAVTAPRQPWFRFLGDNFQFIGSVSSKEFRLTPVIRGRNTYLPNVRGIIQAMPAGSKIQLVQTLHPIAIAVVIGGFLALPLIIKGLQGLIGGVVALLIFHCGMYFIGFRPEAQKTEERIHKLAA